MSSKPKAKSLGELLKKAKQEAPAQPRRVKVNDEAPLVVRSLSFTPATAETLDRLIGQVSERRRRKTSASAVVRALLRYVERQDVAPKIAAAIEAELNAGEVVWGKAPMRQ
jgi:predicted transcriptional regulator